MMCRNFFLRILIIGVLLILTDFILGGLFRYLYDSSRYGVFGRQVYCFTDSAEDILILGPSTASHNYVPSVLSDSLGESCFNAGSDGMPIFYHYGLLSNYRGERKPRVVIYDLGYTDWFRSVTPSFTLASALDRLAPYYDRTPEIDSLFCLEGKFGKLKYLSRMYCFNSKFVQLMKCHFIPSPEDAGYEALTRKLPPETVLKEVNTPGVVDSLKVTYLQKLIDYVRMNDILLIFVISPRYYYDTSGSLSMGRELARRNGVPLLDMMNQPELMRPEYFADETHLNDTGARKFTTLLAGYLKEVLNNADRW